ncbi:MAG: D-glycero-beta-D-manno-heptose 1-phosphate adenylyltransferase [Marmoricola sp.]
MDTFDAASLTALLRRIADLRVAVLGDALLDLWHHGEVRRLGREAAVPVLEESVEEPSPGGAANCAMNVAALGARTRFLGIVGDDAPGQSLRGALTTAGVDAGLVVVDRGATTPVKHRLLSGESQLARFDTSGGSWSEVARRQLLDRLPALLDGVDLLVVSDYGSGALSAAAPDVLADLLGERTLPVVLDGHDFVRWAPVRPTAVTPNTAEALALLGLPADHPAPREVLTVRSEQLFARTGAAMVLTTLDADGAVLQRPGAPARHVPVRSAEARHTCGAGDTVTAAFALALAAGGPPEDAAALAQEAAAVKVARPATCVCTAADLVARSGGVLPAAALAAFVASHRDAGRRIVFTNGCFDVLHLGHVRSLEEARSWGDVLVVGVNSDASVRRLKGPDRPVVPDQERAALLAALRAVDLVVVFDEDSPIGLLETVRPDVYVKGGDYTADMLEETPLVEALGGRVVTLGYLADHSSTELISRIRSRM